MARDPSTMDRTALMALIERAGMDPAEIGAELLTDAGFDRLRRFVALRARWSGTHNVSGPRARRDPWVTDVLDGLAVAQLSPADRPLADVGAGSGVPGLIVACVQPARPIHLVEPIAKRTAFLRTVSARLTASAVQVHRARWPVALDVEAEVVSRAVVDPAEWPDLAAAGGEKVIGIVRMLAAKRPAFTVPGFELAAAMDYRVADAPRRVERWIRCPTATVPG